MMHIKTVNFCSLNIVRKAVVVSCLSRMHPGCLLSKVGVGGVTEGDPGSINGAHDLCIRT